MQERSEANAKAEEKRRRTVEKNSSSASSLRCERCDCLGHTSDMCAEYRHPRENHIDAVARGRMPHMHGEIRARESRRRRHGTTTYNVNGLDFMLGNATPTDNNCLIDSLRQVLYDQAGIPFAADLQDIRKLLCQRHPQGISQVRLERPNFLELEYHAFDTIELLATSAETANRPTSPDVFSIICVHIANDGTLHAARVGNGALCLYIFNEGNQHFRPLLRLP